jgi:antitoxin (DNA-binding transcriptional repressor) of toxin-antitoxin stability system
MNAFVDTYAAKTQLSRLLARVQSGEEITITRRGTPVARLVPVVAPPARRLGLLAGRIRIAADFDATPEAILDAFEGRDDPAG